MELTILLLNILMNLGILCVVYLAVSGRAYAKKKGENLATKEDMAEITRKVESVRAEYAEKLQTLTHAQAASREATQRHHQLSMAALDKRLEAHQTAYYLWRQMLSKANEENSFAFFQECEAWWEKHCLYLSAEAEDAFTRAMHSGLVCKQLSAHASPSLEQLWKNLRSAGNVIRKAAQLPPLNSELETLIDAKATSAPSENR